MFIPSVGAHLHSKKVAEEKAKQEKAYIKFYGTTEEGKEMGDILGYEESALKALEDHQKAREKQVGGDHYLALPIQPGEFIRKNNIGWYEGNAIKYICRHRLKGGSQDIEKAIHYLELALEEYK